MKTALIAFSAAFLFASFAAQAGPSNAARIDVNMTKDAVILGDAKFEGGTGSMPAWIKEPEKQGKFLTCNFPATSDWKKGSVSFTPDKDGVVVITFLGQNAKEEADRSWIVYDAISANGSQIDNGNFEDGLKSWTQSGKKNASVISSVAKSGSKAIRVNHDNGASQGISVKAGQPVTVSFWFKLAE